MFFFCVCTVKKTYFVITGESRTYLVQTADEHVNRKSGFENELAMDVQENDEEPQLLVDLNPKGKICFF